MPQINLTDPVHPAEQALREFVAKDFAAFQHKTCNHQELTALGEQVATLGADLSQQDLRTIFDLIDAENSLTHGPLWQAYKYDAVSWAEWVVPPDLDAIADLDATIPERKWEGFCQDNPNLAAVLVAVREERQTGQRPDWIDQ